MTVDYLWGALADKELEFYKTTVNWQMKNTASGRDRKDTLPPLIVELNARQKRLAEMEKNIRKVCPAETPDCKREFSDLEEIRDFLFKEESASYVANIREMMGKRSGILCWKILHSLCI